MKKYRIILHLTVIFLIFISGCTTNTQSIKETMKQILREKSFFDGFWIMPNGFITIVKNDLYTVSINGTIINYGIFTFNDTTIRLNWDRNAVTEFDYQIDGDNFIVINAEGNEFVLGMWQRNADIEATYNSDNQLEGYWENRDGNRIRILYIMANGLGLQLTCNNNLVLDVRATVSYEKITPNEIFLTLDTIGMFPIRVPMNVIYERNAIRIGTGNDTTKFLRYVRVQ